MNKVYWERYKRIGDDANDEAIEIETEVGINIGS